MPKPRPLQAEVGSRSVKPDDPEQYHRFVETARELNADETPDAMDRAFERVVKPKNDMREKSNDDPTGR